MNMHTPRREQGQTVTRSYGWVCGDLYRCTLDLSDNTEAWDVADTEIQTRLAEAGYDPGGENDAPDVKTWWPCDRPETDDAR